MKITEYAKKVGVHPITARRWFHNGEIPGAYQLPSGTIMVPDETLLLDSPKSEKTVIYARVSSSSRKDTDLEAQAKRLTDFAVVNGWVVDRVVKEVGSGMNDQRPKLLSMIKDPDVTRIVVEHRDRLTRFGFHYMELLCQEKGVDLVVVNRSEDSETELMEDLTSIITSFCARIYGQRRGKRKTEQLTEELRREDTNGKDPQSGD